MTEKDEKVTAEELFGENITVADRKEALETAEGILDKYIDAFEELAK